MDIMEAIKIRCSIRSYQGRAVEEEKLKIILEAARLAPSASNRQEWRFVVVKNEITRQRLMKAAKGQSFVGEAPVVIACCAQTDNHIMSCGQLCYPIDVAIAIEHMVLKATEEGLGTCWVGAFDNERVQRLLNVPDNVDPEIIITVGYSDDTKGQQLREQVKYTTFTDMWDKKFKVIPSETEQLEKKLRKITKKKKKKKK